MINVSIEKGQIIWGGKMNWFKRLFKKAPVKPVFERRRWQNVDFSIGESFWIDGKKVSYEQWFCKKHNCTYVPKKD